MINCKYTFSASATNEAMGAPGSSVLTTGQFGSCPPLDRRHILSIERKWPLSLLALGTQRQIRKNPTRAK